MGVEFLEIGADALGDAHPRGSIGLRQQDGKLIPTVAKCGIEPATGMFENHLTDGGQKGVARLVAEAVVALFEIVEIEKQQGQGVLASACARNGGVQTTVEAALVEEARKLVGFRDLGQTLLQFALLGDVLTDGVDDALGSDANLRQTDVQAGDRMVLAAQHDVAQSCLANFVKNEDPLAQTFALDFVEEVEQAAAQKLFTGTLNDRAERVVRVANRPSGRRHDEHAVHAELKDFPVFDLGAGTFLPEPLHGAQIVFDASPVLGDLLAEKALAKNADQFRLQLFRGMRLGDKVGGPGPHHLDKRKVLGVGGSDQDIRVGKLADDSGNQFDSMATGHQHVSYQDVVGL